MDIFEFIELSPAQKSRKRPKKWRKSTPERGISAISHTRLEHHLLKVDLKRPAALLTFADE
jgi:hypothetical protein